MSLASHANVLTGQPGRRELEQDSRLIAEVSDLQAIQNVME
jgi:hypothetical protein